VRLRKILGRQSLGPVGGRPGLPKEWDAVVLGGCGLWQDGISRLPGAALGAGIQGGVPLHVAMVLPAKAEVERSGAARQQAGGEELWLQALQVASAELTVAAAAGQNRR